MAFFVRNRTYIVCEIARLCENAHVLKICYILVIVV